MTLRSVRALFVACALPGTLAAQIRDDLPADTLANAPTRDAYLDDTARRLVLGVKAARDTARQSLD